ncbi:hypothetical protein HMY34_19645 [Thiothrix subterranea]|uniref:hypothetical protein n=1 Tax=Thiothrix subterranea TaxID=2735563 RepID=UPI00192CDE9B|nr:hypothetical protein [Thiothrix subterranea]QQZ30789.1 hypothetical protein HMY34_19645 [Thiothrix subterranea]
MDILTCTVPANCQSFVDGFNGMVSILSQLFPAMLVIIAAVKITRFAGEDG